MAVEPLGDHLYRAVSGTSPRTAEGRALARGEYEPGMLVTLRDAVGGVGPLARFLGVARTTVQRWFGGAGMAGRPRQPTAASQNLIVMGMRAIRARRSLRRISSRTSITIRGRDRYEPGRERAIKLDHRHLRSGWQDDLVNAYLVGGTTGLRDAFLDANTDRWYREYFASELPDFGLDVTGVKL